MKQNSHEYETKWNDRFPFLYKAVYYLLYKTTSGDTNLPDYKIFSGMTQFYRGLIRFSYCYWRRADTFATEINRNLKI